MRAGGSRLHYQQFDYSTSDPERERSKDVLSDAPDLSEAEPPAILETLMPRDEQPRSPEPANDDDLPLFAQHGVFPELSQTQDVSAPTAEAEVSLAGTSAPLLTNPSLTDVPIIIPPLPHGTSKTLKPVTPGFPAPTSWLLNTTSLANVVGAGRVLFYLVQHKQQIPSIMICACARKYEVVEDVLEVALIGGPDDTLPFLHSKQLVKLTHSHQLHRILILMRSLRRLHPMLTKAPHRLTHTMAYAVV